MKKVVLRVGKFRQPSVYTCGSAALKVVMDFFGKKISIKKIIKLSKPDPKGGTLPRNLILATKRLGFKVFQKFNASIKDIENASERGFPVFVVYQAWGGGHYSVIYGFDKKYFYISDPAIGRGYRKIRKDLLVKRWHDFDMYGKPYKRWMMIVRK